MNGNGRPLSTKKKVQIMIALTILAWATQTLFHKWGFGAELPTESSEKFVPGTARFAAGATLEIRAEATLRGGEVKLKQVCRWSDADKGFFAPVANLTLTRIDDKTPFRSVSVEEIRHTLHDAGINLAVVKFAGPTSCTISRADVMLDEQAALQEWIDAKRGKAPAVASPKAVVALAQTKSASPVQTLVTDGADAAPAAAVEKKVVAEATPAHSLRSILMDDLSVRLGVREEELQVNFNPHDEKVLNLSEPQFKFNVEARRVRNLGDVAWDVLIVTEGGTQKVAVNAVARAWQMQAVLTRPLAFKQTIRATDLVERRVLVDKLSDEPVILASQAVGQQAARELKPGTVLGARMVDPVPLVKAGQFVTITLNQGAVQIKTVAKALDGGAFGQTIKVKNEATRDVFEVVLTGPQEGTLGPATPASGTKVASATE